MNNEQNDLVRCAIEKIKRDEKFKPNCCFVMPTGGITGPTGPQGPATITVGLTTTSAPGTDATASITGTSPDFILNLTIPQGPTGPAA